MGGLPPVWSAFRGGGERFGRPRPPPRYMGYYGIRSTNGRYASYRNFKEFLLIFRRLKSTRMLMYTRKAEGGIIMRGFALLLLASNLGFCVGDKKPQKVAILGGGAASCTAALALTGQPGWKERYNITIYQLGWRLGGKAASGRNKNYGQRLEAIAGHHFPSTFIQTKTLMRSVYEELNRPEGAPLRTFEEAF